MKRKPNSETSNRRGSRTSYFSRHVDFVCRFCSPTLKPKARKKLLASAKKSEIYAICECIDNVVSQTCPVPEHTVSQLGKYQLPLLKLVQPKRKVTIDERKKILSQRGSGIFLPLILSTVASYLIDKIRK